MVGQYPFAAFVGKLLDKYGPRMCSFLASLLFSLGLGLFSLEIANTPEDISVSSASSFRRLAVYFGMAGLATVLSYAQPSMRVECSAINLTVSGLKVLLNRFLGY